MTKLVRKVMMLLTVFLLACSIGFAQPGNIIDEYGNLIIQKDLTVEVEGRKDIISFRRVLCVDPTKNLETVNIVGPKVQGQEKKPMQLKLKVNGENFSLEPCTTIYSSAEANSTPVEGYCFVVPIEIQKLILNYRESVSLSYGTEGNMVVYVPSREEQQDLGFMHIWTSNNAGLKKK